MYIKKTIGEFAKKLPYEIPEYWKPLMDKLSKVKSKKEWDAYITRCLYGRGRTKNFGCYCLPEKSLEEIGR